MLDRVLALASTVPFALGAVTATADRGEVLFRFRDPAIVEASALVVTKDGLLITSNDSGDTGRVFAVDPSTGDTVGVTSWSADPTDVEALAPGPRRAHGGSSVWVGDIGDNSASRTTVQVALVPVGRGDRTVRPTVYDLAYPDGAHDAETLVRDPATDRLYLATKGVFGGTLYAAPARLSADQVNRLTAVGRVLPIATDGAFFPDGRHLVIRNYGVATIYAFPSLEPVRTIRLPAQQQGEGIGITQNERLWVDSEGPRSAVLKVTLPRALLEIVDPGFGPAATASPTPAVAHPVPGAGSGATPRATDGSSSWWLGAGALVSGLLIAGIGWGIRRRSRVE